MTSPAIRRQDDDDDEWEYVNLDDINNGARAETDYQIIPIGWERAGADFLMRMTMRMRMRMTMTMSEDEDDNEDENEDEGTEQ